MKRTALHIAVPILAFVLYILFGTIFASLIPGMMSNLFFDIAALLVLCTAAFVSYRRRKGQQHEKVRFSFFGWAAILFFFFLLYIAAESIGNYLYLLFPVGSTDSYVNMSGFDLYLYVVLACTLGPVCEELLFRFVMFRSFRKVMPFWFAELLSTFFFCFFHGTVMHIPVAFALSAFLCIFYEVTGEFRWCILFHILFNFMATTYLIAISTRPVIMSVLYLAVLLCVFFAYQFREKVFGTWFKIGGLSQLEAYLDEKRSSLSGKGK